VNMTNIAEVSSRQRTTSPGALTRVELELELPSEVSAFALAIDDPPAVLAALDGPGTALPGAFAMKRRAEFLAGRYAAGLALSVLTDLPAGPLIVCTLTLLGMLCFMTFRPRAV